MVLNHCTSSNDALCWFIFVQSYMKIFSSVLKLSSRHNARRKKFEGHNSIKM